MKKPGFLLSKACLLFAFALPMTAYAQIGGYRHSRPSGDMVRCSMQLCVDPWNRYSNNVFMCDNSDQWVARTITVVTSSENEAYRRLSNLAVHWNSTFQCERL